MNGGSGVRAASHTEVRRLRAQMLVLRRQLGVIMLGLVAASLFAPAVTATRMDLGNQVLEAEDWSLLDLMLEGLRHAWPTGGPLGAVMVALLTGALLASVLMTLTRSEPDELSGSGLASRAQIAVVTVLLVWPLLLAFMLVAVDKEAMHVTYSQHPWIYLPIFQGLMLAQGLRDSG